jgi:hypothetical protein
MRPFFLSCLSVFPWLWLDILEVLLAIDSHEEQLALLPHGLNFFTRMLCHFGNYLIFCFCASAGAHLGGAADRRQPRGAAFAAAGGVHTAGQRHQRRQRQLGAAVHVSSSAAAGGAWQSHRLADALTDRQSGAAVHLPSSAAAGGAWQSHRLADALTERHADRRAGGMGRQAGAVRCTTTRRTDGWTGTQGQAGRQADRRTGRQMGGRMDGNSRNADGFVYVVSGASAHFAAGDASSIGGRL